MNPYAEQLGNRNALEVIAETPGQLAEMVGRLGPEGMGRSLAPGKWTAREILCHLADAEMVFAFRIRQTVAEPHYVVQPYDQDAWAEAYSAYDAKEALAVFSAVRQWNVALMRRLPQELLSKPLTHPERGTMTLDVLLQTIAGHDLNHIRQFEQLASK